MLQLSARLRSVWEMVEAAMFYDDIKDTVRTALRDTVDLGDSGWLWVRDINDSVVVYEIEHDDGTLAGLYQRSYSIGEDGALSFGDPQAVRQVTTYEVITEEAATEAQPGTSIFESDIVPLLERAVDDDGTVPIKIIAPGWGSSGYYSAETLQAAAPVFHEGLHMFVDHPSESEAVERPERSLRDLAGVLVEDARWEDEGAQGPGLYSAAKVVSGFAGVLDEIAPHIGVSIRASGRRSEGEAEGVRGLLVTEITDAASVDFVTLPGAGGAIGTLVESARSRTGQSPERTQPVSEKEKASETVAESTDELREMRQELARMQEREVLRDARELVERDLRGRRLPDIVVSRLTESLSANPPYTEARALDRAALTARIEEAVTAELAYLEQIAPSGRVTGMGGGPAPEIDEAEVTGELEASFAALGLSEAASKRAAAV